MFSSLKSRLLLGVYIFIVISIPVGAYLVSQNQTYKSSASESKQPPKIVKSTPKPISSPSSNSAAQDLLNLSQPSPNPNSSSEPPSPTLATSFGPTLSLKVSLDGRPKDNQSTKLFVGISEGSLSSNPKFLLSFTIDLPKDGAYSNLSLAGLNAGTKYTALLKGSAQIATSSAFIMSPTVTNLNDGEAIYMLTGDLNEDNIINSSDYTIARKAYGATSTSANWNENADFNKDGIINLFDLAIINKNLSQTGDSGTWTSPIPKTASPSGTLATQASSAIGGYWIWVPK